MNIFKTVITVGAITLLSAVIAVAQQPPAPYGAPMSLDTAKKAMAAAETEATANKWPVAIAILDTTGSLIMLQKLDNTQTGSVEIAIGKVKQETEFVYAGESEESGVKLEKIDFTSKLTLVPNAAQNLKLTLKEQTQTGHALFSAEQGRVVSAEQTQHLVTESPYRETTITVSVDSTVKTVVSPMKK